ncbi:MAG TPA: Gfo/Idh/MocA family oxidoreductase [Oscillospiraceae bacterium]|nr:Gfo/Idh/MocA family oxidoreductase [Oscillospiraceae bacterium]HPF56836.1 Gfo/Idh/MocA family oxidoreductase [Clostridiales bacterium]HPK35255.1 Gfo/Idh/MocA family oxidoreductase [Oscillospiraceae bacterium]HPR75448.1 Gfo/Idh/MocA family oxidoreductase [Oscillospiraceae bacterium]
MNKVRVALVGCGSFIRAMHIPILKANPKYEIRATMDISESAAADTAKEVGAVYFTTDIDKILSDSEIDAVFIGTRHDTHAALSVKAANAGKHVLCEKPMGLSREECQAVVEAVKKAGVKYTVGYNRGMAPMIVTARDLLKDNDHKKMIYHRIQAPFPADVWTHDPKVGGGRFIGEGCHIFDLLCEIVGKPPVSVYASGGTFLDPEKVKIPDSAIVTITFADGSVGTTLIASAGCSAFPKESTEIYCDGKAIWVNDFTAMEYYGFEGHAKTTLAFDKVDKGHTSEIDQFADAILLGKDSPNGLVKAARAAVLSYMVNESLASGKPVAVSEKDYLF